jgi:hypothetical protein
LLPNPDAAKQIVYCADHVYLDWSSFLVGVIGTIAGLRGLSYGRKQLAAAQTAKQAEAKVRDELHRVITMQRVVNLSDQIQILSQSIRAHDVERSVDLSGILLPTIAHLEEFVGQALNDNQRTDLLTAKGKLETVLTTLMSPLSSSQDWNWAQGECMEALKSTKKIVGSLEKKITFQVN